jgi:hypothetical protein
MHSTTTLSSVSNAEQQITEINKTREVWKKRSWSDDDCDIEIDIIHHEKRNGRNGWKKYFMPPTKIKDVVGDS